VRLVFGLIEVNVRHLSGSLRPKLLWLVQRPPVDRSELGPNAPETLITVWRKHESWRDEALLGRSRAARVRRICNRPA
jgi:hypothetical protein